MSLEDDFKLERYKLVTDRQKYFTELARDSFAYYIKIFTALAMAAITILSASSRLGLEYELLRHLIFGVAGLVTFLGIAAIGQIVFCLFRWRGYRHAERDVYPDSPPIKWWWWIFESLYCVCIAISVGVVWAVSKSILALISKSAV